MTMLIQIRSHRAPAPWPKDRNSPSAFILRMIVLIQSRPTPGQARSRSPTLKLPAAIAA